MAAQGDSNVIDLFQDILIDMPVGAYFRKYIDIIIKGAVESGEQERSAIDMAQISEKIASIPVAEQLVNIKKIWITEFHRWVMRECNDTTREHMDELLKAESDWETLQIVYNTLSQSQNASGKEQSKKWFNNLGHLHPGRTTGDSAQNSAKASIAEVKDFAEL